MDLSTALAQMGFRRTVAPGRGGSKTQVGEFNERVPLDGRGPAQLKGRYGLDLESAAGAFEGEAKPDPSVIALWLRSVGPHGGKVFLDAAVQAGTLGSLSQIDPPNDTTNTDIMLISRNGKTTFYHDVLRPWLEATGGGQNPDEGVVGDSVLAARVKSLEDRVAQLEARR